MVSTVLSTVLDNAKTVLPAITGLVSVTKDAMQDGEVFCVIKVILFIMIIINLLRTQRRILALKYLYITLYVRIIIANDTNNKAKKVLNSGRPIPSSRQQHKPYMEGEPCLQD